MRLVPRGCTHEPDSTRPPTLRAPAVTAGPTVGLAATRVAGWMTNRRAQSRRRLSPQAMTEGLAAANRCDCTSPRLSTRKMAAAACQRRQSRARHAAGSGVPYRAQRWTGRAAKASAGRQSEGRCPARLLQRMLPSALARGAVAFVPRAAWPSATRAERERGAVNTPSRTIFGKFRTAALQLQLYLSNAPVPVLSRPPAPQSRVRSASSTTACRGSTWPRSSRPTA